jgi:hypothetical protein
VAGDVAKCAEPYMQELRAKVDDTKKAVDTQVTYVTDLKERTYQEIAY